MPTSLRATCPNCGRSGNVPIQALGKTVTCRQCGNKFKVAAAIDETSKPIATAVPSPKIDDWFKNAAKEGKPLVAPPPSAAPIPVETPIDQQLAIRTDQAVIVQVMPAETGGAAHSFGLASMVVGGISLPFGFCPPAMMVSIPLGVIGILLGIAGCVLSIVRRGRGLGFSIGGCSLSAASLLATFIVMSFLSNIGKGFEKMVIGEDRQKFDKADKLDWVDASMGAIRNGETVVQIDSVSIEFPKVKRSFGNDTTWSERLLVVRLSIKNESATKKVDYSGWGGEDGLFGERRALLKDNFGNSHHSQLTGFEFTPVGATRFASIFPGKSVSDVLAFDLPVDKAAFLRLQLSASNIRGKDYLRFHVPAKMIERK